MVSIFNSGDILVFIVIGILGWFMKQLAWPRPPLLIGFVLTTPAERYLHRATERYGTDWLTRGVLITALLVIAVVVIAIVHNPTAVTEKDAPLAPRRHREEEKDQAGETR